MHSWFLKAPRDSVVNQLENISMQSRKTVKMRVLSFLFVSSCYALIGHTSIALIYAIGLTVVETLIAVSNARRQPPTNGIRRIDVFIFGALEFLASIFYISLGLITVYSESPSIMLLGLLWTVGVLNFTSFRFARWDHFSLVYITPAAIGLLAFVTMAGSQPMRTSTTLEVVCVVLGTLFLFNNTYQLITSQRRIEKALETAKQDAAQRLEALEFVADHDDLTGLLNRASFNERLRRKLQAFQQEQRSFSLLLLDLDGFKPINDGFGHPAGDSILTEVSGRLRNTVGRDGFVARVGGDEFGIVLNNIDEPDILEDVALNLIRVVGLPVKFKDVELSVGASIGVAICTDQLNTLERIITAADEALYQAKQNNKSAVELFHPSIARKRVPLAERKNIETAIKEKLIRPFYQPKFCLKTRNVVGFEALARWPIDPTKPSESADFVSKIEQMGLLSEFTYQMARQVFTDVKVLLDEGFDPGQVSLNLSEVTLATVNGLEDLEWLLAENERVVPHITLEITEDVFIARSGERIRESIRVLRDIGVRISLDDFGTGFASFQHLRQLEFDELKIDTEFVRGLGVDPTANVIVNGFLSIAQGLGVSVVAEGVETEAQRRYLLDRGCPVAQGFLHSKAQPLDEIRKYLKASDQKALG